MEDVIDVTELPSRIRLTIQDLGVQTWRELAKYKAQDLLRRGNFGRGSLNIVNEELRKRGLQVEPPPSRFLGRVLPKAGVYFVRGADLIKIGSTTYIPKRVKDLQAMSPVPLTLLAWIHVPFEKDLRYHEREHHLQFKVLHAYNEWYRYENPLCEYIDKLSVHPA